MFDSIAFLPWAINSAASRCAPVPQSKISKLPLAVITSTQDVLPPKWFVPGPGVAIDPLVPQKRTFTSLRSLGGGIDRQGNSNPLFSPIPPIAACAPIQGSAGCAPRGILPSGRRVRNAHDGKLATCIGSGLANHYPCL